MVLGAWPRDRFSSMVVTKGYLARNWGVRTSLRMGSNPALGARLCWACCRANLMNSQAPDGFAAPVGMPKLAPPSKVAVAPPLGAGNRVIPIWDRNVAVAVAIGP